MKKEEVKKLLTFYAAGVKSYDGLEEAYRVLYDRTNKVLADNSGSYHTKQLQSVAASRMKKLEEDKEESIAKLRSLIALISSPIVREVFEDRYINSLPWEAIAEKNYYTVRTITNYKNKGIDEIVKALSSDLPREVLPLVS